ncbi:MAG: YdcF family protein [Holosporales bacterium]
MTHSHWYRRVLILLGLPWASGLVLFAALLPHGPQGALQPTDAIVVLTGGPDRVRTGLSLYTKGLAQQLFITGVHKETTLEELLQSAGYSNLRNKKGIVLDYDALNTIENAQQTAGWTRDQSLRSIRVVTASYHMPRSLLEISQRLKNVKIIPHPIIPRDFHPHQWWRSPKTCLLIFQEYHKYLAALVRAGLRSAILAIRKDS